MINRDSDRTAIIPLALSTVGLTCLFPYPVSAQVIPDNSLGSESSILTPNVTVKDAITELIEGGAIRGNNLFHSFEQFNISNGGRVYFANPDGIANILTRVTGNNLSEIFGTLGVDGAANLFILNPNGIVFGENAALDVNGSFLATTADSYLFENGFEYSASNPNSPPLLTINAPVGVQFGSNIGAIQVRGTGHNLTFDEFTYIPVRDERSKGLEVNSGNTLALLGGEINLTGGNLTAGGGRIELGSVAEEGNVSIIPTEDGLSFDYGAINQFGDINLTQASSVEVSGNSSGNIRLQSQNLLVEDLSVMINNTIGSENAGESEINATESVNIHDVNDEGFASAIFNQVEIGATGKGADLTIETGSLSITDGGAIAATKYGDGDGGNINIIASELVEMKGLDSVLNAEIYGGAGEGGDINITTPNLSLDESSISTATDVGNAGDVNLEVENLSLINSAQILSGTFAEGNAGDINLKATDVEFIGRNEEYIPSGLFATTERGSTGNAGNINLEVGNLRLIDGAVISSNIKSSGNGGNLTIKANSVELRGIDSNNGFASQIFTATYPDSTGNAGNINLEVENLRITDGGQIATGTFGEGDGGNLTLKANSVEIIGANSQLEESPSGIFSSAQAGSTGNAGDINLETDNLLLADGAVITGTTRGEGNAGNITLTGNSFELTGSSGILTSAKPGSIGEAGDITLEGLENLSITNGAQISSSTSGEGNAGDLEIQTRQLQISGISATIQDLSSNISAFSETDADAGSITINSDNVTVTQNGEIAVSNSGNGNAGNLNINTQELSLDNSGKLRAEVAAGSQGNINLTTDSIFLFNNSEISVLATDTATGGNVTINNTDNIVLLDNSQIIADAIEGNGGNINITTVGLFRSPDSKITASSQFGLDGNVEIKEINGDRKFELNQLPENIVDASNLITASCLASDNNAFAITGNGGIPNSPYSTQSLTPTWYDLRPINQETATVASFPPLLEEANTTIVNSDGEIELVALTPLSSYRWVKSSCGN